MTAEVVDIAEHLPTVTAEALCLGCGDRWVGVWPDRCLLRDLVCPTCSKFGGVIATGQERLLPQDLGWRYRRPVADLLTFPHEPKDTPGMTHIDEELKKLPLLQQLSSVRSARAIVTQCMAMGPRCIMSLGPELAFAGPPALRLYAAVDRELGAIEVEAMLQLRDMGVSFETPAAPKESDPEE